MHRLRALNKRHFSVSAIRSEKVTISPKIHLHVESSGPETGLPILCIPGALGAAHSDFGPQLQGLAENKFRTIAFDPRGCGNSQPPTRDFPLDFLHRDADDGVALMKALGHEKFSVMGFSDGANSAALLAATYPEVVDRLILIAGNAFITDEDIEAYDKVRDISKWSSRTQETLRQIYGPNLESIWAEWIKTMSKIYDEGGDICCGALPDIKCKTLVVHGKEDWIVPEAHGEYLAERIMHCRMLSIPDGKHHVHLQQPHLLNSEITRFLLEEDDQAECSREFTAIPTRH